MLEQMRSLLLVSPLDSDLLNQAYDSDADCIVLDLMGCTADLCKGKGLSCLTLKDSIARSLAERNVRSKLFIRASHPGTLRTEKELLCIMSIKPEAVILPCAIGHEDVACLSAMLSVIEAQYDIEDGATQIIAISGETTAGLMASPTFSLSTNYPAHRRLLGLSWDEIALSAEVGSEGYGLPADQKAFARSMTLMAARSAKVCAFDTPSLQHNAQLFEQECRDAFAAGYEGKFTIDPSQVAVINRIFE